MRHHTKDKGDAGLGFVMADLLANNIQVALPISEHLPFDCIAISEDNRLIRLSVKYRKIVRGVVSIQLRSIWADRHGTHYKAHDKTAYDVTAIYCPDMKQCYYVRNDEVGEVITLRIELPKNNQKKRVLMADRFVSPKRIFAPVA